MMSPNKDETAIHGCHCVGGMAVSMLTKGTGHTAKLCCVTIAFKWFTCILVCVSVKMFPA